jgi:hypothetical protein
MAMENERKRFAGVVDFLKDKSEKTEEEAKPQFASQADKIVVEELTDMIRKRIQTGKMPK